MDSRKNLLHSRRMAPEEGGELLAFTREEVGWEWMSFDSWRLLPGEFRELRAEGEEVAVVLLGGCCSADWGSGAKQIGARKNVFDGLPYTLYLPHGSRAALRAETLCEFASCRVPSVARLEPALIEPAQVTVGLRGGENASRQIVDVIPPAFPADKLIVIEVYTPGGNWSSYPPHKHDVHLPPAEVDLDEIYYFRMRDGRGFAYQNLYSRQAPRDEVLKVRDGDLVLVRDGYHPVVAGPGYDIYYLNFLAGSARALAAPEDPEHRWLRESWKAADPRLPLVGK